MAAAAEAQISKGALDAIFNDPENATTTYPVPICQCVQIKALGSTGDNPSERYRLVLSDVNNFVQSMLATQANHVVHDGKLKKGSIVRLKSWQANEVKGKRILIVLDLDVIENLGEIEKIGDPVTLPPREEEEVKPVSTTIGGSGFYGNNKPQPAQRVASRTVPTSSSSGSHGTIYPIEALSPYAHKWTIKARVTSKSEIRTWQKTSSEGKLFSVNLLDESGEIKATGFNDQCDALYDVFQEGSVYYISNPCRVQLARKQFSNIPNDYELTFEKDTLIEKAEDQENVPQVRYNFTTIGQLQDVDKDSTIDVIGVLKEVADVNQIESKTTGKGYDKRDLTIVDDSGFSIRLTIWGKTATTFDTNPESIVAFKGAKVSEFNGRSLSLLSSGSMSLNPDIPEAHKLKGWYDSQGRTESFATHTGMAGAGAAGGRKNELKTISQVRDENLGMSEKDDYFDLKATLVFVKQDPIYYPACITDNCNKKATELPDGNWHCERCSKSYPKPQYRYMMTINAADHTGQLYLNCFDDIGRLVMGMTADQLLDLKENDPEGAHKAFNDASCRTLSLRCRARMDTYNETQRIRYQALTAAPIDFVSESRRLTELIKLYNID